MIETSLIRLDEAVQDGQKLIAGSKVILPIGEEAEIYGFIAIQNNPFSMEIDSPPLGECFVIANRVVFTLENQLHRFPIFNSVTKATEERYGLYLLYIPKFLNLSQKCDREAYLYSMTREIPHYKVWKIEGVKVEEKVAYYYPNEDDLYFESKSKFRAIGSGFVIVTRRLSKSTENIKYEVFDSHTVMIERK